MATGRITSGGSCRWGPDTSIYDLDSTSSVSTNEVVTVFWREGNFYYIEYQVGSTSGRKRMYYPTGSVTITSGTVPTYTATKEIRYITTPEDTRYAPYGATGTLTGPKAGSLIKPETVRYTGKKEGNYALVDYDVSGGTKKKRAWFPHMSLRAAPVPSTSTVYASNSTASTTALTSAQKDANAEYIFSYLTSLGFSKQAACGILGNIQQESVLNPGIWQVSGSLTKGYGLVQWTPATVFLNRAVSDGIISSATAAQINALAGTSNPKTLMNAELDSLIWCVAARGDWIKPTGSMQHTNYSMTLKEFMESTLAASTLAIVFHDHYERSGDSLSYMQTTRAAYATAWYNKLA